ncbi:MAG: hypothetical protein NZ610_08325 [Candidatus Bipolaricaulota bacterium]|nr:hypothetical protein [Candidatus Bipolaricaulota bacterium]MCS7275382.1 hypothetical protein [Candidatus Bipolaricaulota bacterium]MDW8110119.1 hypothetical protein [Candidatus Bipolaricaulota bacterium]MDW8328961.1 hypothetical protein [Candidatus Bipolaricaulota bacterium]
MKKILTLSLVLLLIGTLSSTAQRVAEQGKFLYQLTNKNNNKTEVAGEELFKIEELDRGNRRITANFVAKSQEIISQYETDKLFNETITVDKDWKLVEYSLRSETALGQLSVNVKVTGQIAKIDLKLKRADGREQNQSREVILEDEFVTTGVAAGQLMIMQKIITLKMKEPKRTFLALDPTNFEKPLIELTVERLSPVKVKTGTKTLDAQRYSVQRADADFKLELLSSTDGTGTLWGFTGESATSRLLVYRQDLFAEGFEVLK